VNLTETGERRKSQNKGILLDWRTGEITKQGHSSRLENGGNHKTRAFFLTGERRKSQNKDILLVYGLPGYFQGS
jgi:hypothetical protein